jgi:hypothetical protein
MTVRARAQSDVAPGAGWSGQTIEQRRPAQIHLAGSYLNHRPPPLEEELPQSLIRA